MKSWVLPNPMWLVSLKEEEIWMQKETAGMHVYRRKTTQENGEMEAIQPRREASDDTFPHSDLGLAELQVCEKINF